MKTILIVDDTPAVIRVLKINLEAEGYIIDSATNGNEALAKLAIKHPDAMITDIQMPGMGGQGLCEKINEQWPQRAFHIVVMTSMTEREQRDWVKKLSNIQFLEKPLSPRKVIALLRQVFAQPAESHHV